MARRQAKPIRHGNKWRIRWDDEGGKRKSEVFDNFKDAEFALSRHFIRMEEIKRGLRLQAPPDKTFNDLCDYWLLHRTPMKKRKKKAVHSYSCRARSNPGKIITNGSGK